MQDLIRLFFFGSVCTIGLIISRTRNLRRLHQRILKCKTIDVGKYLGMDVGGTLTKVVYFRNAMAHKKPSVQRALDHLEDFLLGSKVSRFHEANLTIQCPTLGGQLHFYRFETRNLIKAIAYIARCWMHSNIMTLAATGGGAHKFYHDFNETLGINLSKQDEMNCLIKGLNFVLQHFPEECYTWKNVSLNRSRDHTTGSPPDSDEVEKLLMPRNPNNLCYPFLLVNIGSGVSILKISSETEYERVSGTSLGGGTFWGLSRLLTHYQTFEESMEASTRGDNATVDMLVGDIYGHECPPPFGLTSDTIASSFGKVGIVSQDARAAVSEPDLSRSLLTMITQNIGQVAYLNACRHDARQIYFGGNFLRNNAIASRQLAYAIDYWSKGQMQGAFFHHEGYLGALGAYLQGRNDAFS